MSGSDEPMTMTWSQSQVDAARRELETAGDVLEAARLRVGRLEAALAQAHVDERRAWDRLGAARTHLLAVEARVHADTALAGWSGASVR